MNPVRNLTRSIFVIEYLTLRIMNNLIINYGNF